MQHSYRARKSLQRVERMPRMVYITEKNKSLDFASCWLDAVVLGNMTSYFSIWPLSMTSYLRLHMNTALKLSINSCLTQRILWIVTAAFYSLSFNDFLIGNFQRNENTISYQQYYFSLLKISHKTLCIGKEQNMTNLCVGNLFYQRGRLYIRLYIQLPRNNVQLNVNLIKQYSSFPDFTYIKLLWEARKQNLSLTMHLHYSSNCRHLVYQHNYY